MSGTATRDRVPAAQEKVVISRSGNLCAYPKCAVELTIDADATGDRPKATGKVAHICAASPGGPRYDDLMTAVERGSAENLIYLCGPHHDAVDSQLEKHTREFLEDAKRSHEKAVARAVRVALGSVTYEELSVVCSVLVSAQSTEPMPSVELALPLQQKIELNGLGPGAVERITDGLSQAARVGEFVAFQNHSNPEFGRRLVARFRANYYDAVAGGLGPDEIFDYLVDSAQSNGGLRDTPIVRAAALAVIAYLFELCEIFERA